MILPDNAGPSLIRSAAFAQVAREFGTTPGRAAVKALLRQWLEKAVQDGRVTMAQTIRNALQH